MRSVARARPQMTVKHDWSPVVCLAAAVVVSAVFLFVVFRRRRKEIMPECVLPNGLMINHLRKAETDLLFGEIFKGDCYKLPDGDPDMEVMSIHLEPGDVVVDVGANIGMFAIWAAQHEQVAGKVRVLSFECVPSTYSVLEKNAQRYSQGQCRLEAFAYGLSDAERTEVIYHHPNFSIWSTSKCDMDGARDAMLKENLPHLAARASARADLPAALRWLPAAVFRQLVCWGGARVIAALNKVEAIQCRFRRLSDAVFTESGVERVALLKIDVEGAELDVLRGIDAAHVRGTLLSILHTCTWTHVTALSCVCDLTCRCLTSASHLLPTQWSRIDQVAMELENDALAEQVTTLLQGVGFAVRTWRSADMAKLLPTSQVKQLLARRTSLSPRRGASGRVRRRHVSPGRDVR